MLTSPIYKLIRPEFCVQGCDIARACEGYITSEDTKRKSYILYIGPVSRLYTIYCMMVTSSAWKVYIRTHHIKGMMSPSCYIIIYIYICYNYIYIIYLYYDAITP